MENTNTFAGFTNLYELSKTLRFELKPVGETEKLLEENMVFGKDKTRQLKYEEIKPYFNRIHLDFIDFSLSNLNLDFFEFQRTYLDFKKEPKNKDKESIKKSEEQKLRNKIIEQFNKKAWEYLQNFPEVKFTKKDVEFLFEIWIFEILKKKYWDESEIYITDQETGEILTDPKTWIAKTIFDDWHGWLGYLTKFFETRKNLYKSDATSTALATRIIDQNLKRFCDNLEIFNKLKDEVSFWSLEQDFGTELNQIFSLEFYNHCILQKDIQWYNDIVWWKLIDNNKKIPWINEYINKYKQDNPWKKLPYLHKLDKQILSEKKDVFIQQIENETDFTSILTEFYNNSKKKIEILEYIFSHLWNYENDDYKTIYISKEAFNTIAHKFTDKVLIFEKNVFDEMKKDKLVETKDFDKKEEKYRFPNFIPLFYIKKWLENYSESELFFKSRYYEKNNDERKEMNEQARNIYIKTALKLKTTDENIWENFCAIFKYEFSTLLSNTIINQNWDEKEIWFNVARNSLEAVIEDFTLTEENKWIVKDLADISKTIYQVWKYFALEKKRDWDNTLDLNDEFYKTEYSPENPKHGYLEFYDNAYEQIIVPYNLMRNFIAKKPWEDKKKWKLNFENSSLLKGWDKDFESYGSYIFKKNQLYYLWIINGKKLDNSEVEKLYNFWDNSIKAERFVYDFQKPDNKNTPRLFIRSKWDNFAPSVAELWLPIHDIIEIYDKRLFSPDKKNPHAHKSHLVKLIDYFKLWFSKHNSYKHFHFVWKESEEYENIADFYRDVEKSCYKPTWENINFDELTNLTKKKRIYLFQIYNKNFELENNIAPKDYIFKWNGKDNTHTLYFKWLFEEANIKHPKWVNIKLSWWGEVFFRPQAIEKIIDTQRKTKNEIIVNKRYSQDKIFLHFPIQLNFKENTLNFNNYTNSFLANNQNINIIWIDRWEKHLAYYSVINQKQEILESGSLNYIYQKDSEWNIIKKAEKKILEKRNDEGKIFDYELIETWTMVDYEDYGILLDYKEKKRRLERQSWKEVEQIKDLKKWYISAVVRKLADLIIKHNAIVIFEDLNMRFKQIRWWIEKSVYQQLEKALIDKLNFLVNKGEINPENAWNIIKAYQLTAPIETFKDMWKQTGIIFYTQASYTSKIDPLTSWRPNLYLKKENAEINKKNILKFDSIIFDTEKNRFEITYDLKKFQLTKNDEDFPNKTKWTLCTCVERWKWDKYLNLNKWGYKHFENLTEPFKELFQDFKIDIYGNIKAQITNMEEKWNEKFFSHFIDLFSLLCQIRNTNENETGDKNDIIFSPVEPFFDSRKENKIGVKNGDDNWAFNIARKWIVILERLNEWKKLNDEKINKWEKEIYPELFISNISWDNFTQTHSNI